MAKKVRDVIGATWCHKCGAPVEVRVNTGGDGVAYYFCGREMSIYGGCNAGAKWGGPDTIQMKNQSRAHGWFGPLPESYFPPTERNKFAGHYEGKIAELRKLFGVSDNQRVRWKCEPIESEPDEPRARPVEQPRPEPTPEPEQQPDPGARPVNKRRGLFGRSAS